MKKSVLFMALITPFLFSLQCAKKEKDPVEIQPELVSVNVEIPEVSWEKSIAVLPVRNVTDSVMTKTVAALMTEQLTSTFSKTPKFKILSPSSGDWIKKSRMNPDYILSANLDRAGDTVTVSLNLTDASKDSTVWEEKYQETVVEVFTVSEKVSGSVSQWFAYDNRQPAETKTVLPEVMALYLEGRTHLGRGTREDIDLAVQKFKEALKMDSTFALASVSLAESYLQIVRNQWDHKPVWLRLAQQASLNAIQLDPDMALAHLQLGQVYLSWGDAKQAEENIRKALDLNTNLSEAWAALGQLLLKYGLYKSCLECFDRALALNPGDVPVSLSRSMILNGLKRFREAREALQKALDLYPDQKYIHTFMALTEFYLDHFSAATKEIEKGLDSDEYLPLAHAVLGMILAKTGKLDEALSEVELEVKPHVHNNGSLATAVAAVYALLDQNGQAMSWLEKAASWGYQEYPWLANDPNFDGLREDSRFVEFLKGMKTSWESNMQRYNRTEENIDTH